MRYLSGRLALTLLLSVFAAAAHAQWTQTVTRMFGKPLSFNGISAQFEYQGGVCWAGAQFALYKSTDKGETWQQIGGIWDRITSIRFFNNQIGLLGHGTAGVDLTTDGGVSWRKIADLGNVVSLAFGATPSHILVTTGDAVLARSTDQGASWTYQPTSPSFLFQVQRVHGDTMVRQVGSDLIGTWLEFSNDFGLTWTSPLRGAAAHYDSWMPAIDSCDGSTLYIANEEALLQTDRKSDVFRSTNKGATWTSVFNKPAPYLGGSIQTTNRAVYAGGLRKGVERSTDHGDTWQNMGGPVMMFDCLPFLSVDDSVILAVDTGGNMWRTANAGGLEIPKGVGSITASVDSIGFDTLTFCEEPTPQSVFFARTCSGIESIGIDGDTTFLITGSSADWAAISVRPRCAGAHSATLVIHSNAGQTIRIPLAATTRSSQFAAMPQSIGFDTLGFCESSPTRTVTIRKDCSVLRTAALSGDSAFAIVRTTPDSVVVQLSANDAGDHAATLTITSNAGDTQRVVLTGFTRSPQLVEAVVPILSLRNDTIGGTVRVPIVTGSPSGFPGGAFDISFDTAMLEFEGASDSHGNSLAVHKRTRSATINFGAGVDTVFAEFRIFPRSTLVCTSVAIDSFTSDVAGICYTLALDRADVDICSDGGCGGALLSEFVRRGDIQPLRITPNPGEHQVTITADFPMTSLEVFNTSGDKLLELQIASENTHRLDLSGLPYGTLYIAAHDGAGRTVFGSVIHR